VTTASGGGGGVEAEGGIFDSAFGIWGWTRKYPIRHGRAFDPAIQCRHHSSADPDFIAAWMAGPGAGHDEDKEKPIRSARAFAPGFAVSRPGEPPLFAVYKGA
jgi:hypothetical protein